MTLLVSLGMFAIAPWVQSKMDDVETRHDETADEEAVSAEG